MSTKLKIEVSVVVIMFTVLFALIGWEVDISNHTPIEIYIAGKYSGDTLHNTEDAMQAGERVQLLTCNYPIVPHLWGFSASNFHNYTYQQWMDFDKIALEHSDALYKISSSHGADAEEAYAKQIGKPIYYSLDQIPNRCN